MMDHLASPRYPGASSSLFVVALIMFSLGSSHAFLLLKVPQSTSTFPFRSNHRALSASDTTRDIGLPIIILSSSNSHVGKIRQRHLLFAAEGSDGNDDEKVAIGSNEYYGGFLSRSMDEEPTDRVSGDALLGPTFKFVGGFTLALGALLLGFLASNGLL